MGGSRLDSIGLYWYNPATKCSATTVTSIKGKWQVYGSAPASNDQEHTWTVGHSIETGREYTEEWSSSVSMELSAGFEFEGLSSSTTITEEYSQLYATTHSELFTSSYEGTQTTTIPA